MTLRLSAGFLSTDTEAAVKITEKNLSQMQADYADDADAFLVDFK
jgi:hypothetical protein